MFGDVLIVDDETDICDLIAGVLEDEACEVRVASDSDSALRETADGVRLWFCWTLSCRAVGWTAWKF